MDTKNKRLVKLIREGDSLVIKQIYQDCFHYTTKFVTTNSGTNEDAKECFQQALVVLFRASTKANFEITSEVKHYLAGTINNIWLKEIKRRKKSNKVLTSKDLKRITNDGVDDFDQVLLEEIALDKEFENLTEAMNLVGEKCNTLLNYTFFDNKKDKQISVLMNYSLEFVRQKRSRCLKKLRKILDDL